tara:strand:- start:36 stop:419 length:384 start_codon:yes stop_codon:yes gene_type:complete
MACIGLTVHTQSKLKLFVKCGTYHHINIADYETTFMSATPGDKKVRILKIGQPRTFKKIKDFMIDGDIYTFHDILDYLNSTMRDGCSSHRLANMLSKYPDFIEEGSVMGGNQAHEFKITTWRYVAWE